MSEPGLQRGMRSDEVHLWTAALDVPERVAQALRRTLPPEERQRFLRLRSPSVGGRLAVARGLLRRLLSAYTGIPPRRLRFAYGPRGKPCLGRPPPAGKLHFSVSHSGNLALFGISAGRPLGVDVERLRSVRDLDRLVRRVFSPGEREAFLGVPKRRRAEAFFTAWTRKEAYGKAVGDGLSMGPERVEVTHAPGGPARLLAVDGDMERASGWWLCHLEPEPGFLGALAIEGHGWRVRRWTLEPRQ